MSEKLEKGTIWIVCYYGGLPDESYREYRYTILANALVRRGYRVVWWVASFDHVKKCQRSAPAFSEKGFEIRIVPVPAYDQNISIGRIWSEWKFGQRFKAMARGSDPAQTVILADPARFYGNVVVRVARGIRAKLVLDVMDLWPEIFEVLAPRKLRSVMRGLLFPMYWQRAHLVRASDALAAVVPDYLDSAVVDGSVSTPTHVAYLGWHRTRAEHAQIPAEIAQIIDQRRSGQLIVTYVGTLGRNYDIDTLLAAAWNLRDNRNIRWVVAGAGPLEHKVQLMAQRLPGEQFSYVGLQDAAVIAWLLKNSDVGLCCYRAGSTVSMPLKIYDYLHAGLPIVSSLEREARRLVATRKIGLQYTAEDPQSLASALLAFAGNPEMLREYARNAAECAADFDPVSQHEGYVDFLERHRLIS